MQFLLRFIPLSIEVKYCMNFNNSKLQHRTEATVLLCTDSETTRS